MSRMNMNTLAATTASIAAMGGGAAVEAAPAEAMLNGFGPGMSHNLGTANQQLDARLAAEGPNGCEAHAIGAAAGITTSAGRAKYITPQNVNFRDIRVVTNRQYPTNTGANGSCEAVPIPNRHSTSVVADLEFNSLPKSAIKASHAKHLSSGEWEPTTGVVRLDCGLNALLRQIKAKPHQKMQEQQINVNVSFGVQNAIAAFAIAEAQSSSSSTATCPDGTVVSASASAESSAIAAAAANEEAQTFTIQGVNVSFDQFQAQFNQDVANAEAVVAAAATSSSTTSVKCAPSTPTPTPLPTPTPHGCVASTITEKDGRTVNLTVVADGGADAPSQESVNWGDSQSSSYTGTAPTQVENHFYNSDGTFGDVISLAFPDGGSATCTTQSVTQQEFVPPSPS